MKTKLRIREWYEYYNGNVYVSFSGGKDSTVLLHLVRELYPEVPAIFVDTGLEYPEIREFVKTFNNVTVLRPKISFIDVLNKYGYPVIGKEVSSRIYYARKGSLWAINDLKGLDKFGNIHKYKKSLYHKWEYLLNAPFKISGKCCNITKEGPARRYETVSGNRAILGLQASESNRRLTAYLQTGCNSYKTRFGTSKPLSFWLEQDILHYILYNDLPICSVYGKIVLSNSLGLDRYFNSNVLYKGDLRTTGVDRTGCMFCMFGVHKEKGKNRFQRMKISHPKIYKYCMTKLQLNKVLDYIHVKY